MRGFPVLNLLLTLLLSGAVLLPLVWRHTRVAAAGSAPEAPDTVDAAARVPAHVSLRFVHPPARVRLTDGDAVLHEWNAPQSLTLEESASLPCTDRRVNFGLQIAWPAGTPEANNVVLRVEPRGFQAWNDAIFSDAGAVDEIIEFNCQP